MSSTKVFLNINSWSDLDPKASHFYASLNSGDYTLTFWGPNNCGYTVYLDSAGKYSEELVKQKESYYNNNEDTIAVPCEEVEKVAVKCVPWEGNILKKMGVTW